MKNYRFLLATLFVTALASTASGARYYAQPSVALMDEDGYDSRAGAALAVGATFAGKHSIEIEGSRFDTESRYGSAFKLQLTPLLINYRYEFPICAKLTGSLGVSTGLIFQEIDYEGWFYGVSSYYRYQAKDEAFAIGFNGGLSYQLSDHFSAIVGAKSLRSGKSDVQPRTNLMILQLGINCRY